MRATAVLVVGLAAVWIVGLTPLSAAANPVLVVTSAANDGIHTLRSAITTANARPGPDRIEFNIAGAPPHVIAPTSALPSISGTLVIDGTTDPHFSSSTRIPVVVLDGNGVLDVSSGLEIASAAAGGSVVRGLRIVRWSQDGISVHRARGIVIAGNYIGTNGTADLGNASDGIRADGDSSGLRVGGPRAADRNVISGNESAQVEIAGSSGAVVQGNRIGTNAAGTTDPEPGHLAFGVRVVASPDVLIGGTGRGAGNVISGNQTAVDISGRGAVVQGNRIGTNAGGNAAVTNFFGIRIHESPDVLIGGPTAGARNVISGNTAWGIYAESDGVRIQGNYLGTDAKGSTAIPNGTGISLLGDGNIVGGSRTGAGNVISASGTGVSVQAGAGNLVAGNRIGTSADGTKALGNGDGIFIGFNGAHDSLIGGTAPGAGNVIAFSTRFAIAIGGDAAAQHETIRGNSIHDNAGLGIDMITCTCPGGTGITPNDADDPDIGPNGFQNFPEITAATTDADGTTVSGTLDSTPNTTFLIDVYASDEADDSGNGEGTVYLGATRTQTNASGDATFAEVFPLVGGDVVAATATPEDGPDAGSTSEFSASVPSTGSGGLRVAKAASNVNEGAGTVMVKVERVGGTNGPVSVAYATRDGTAKAPGDYAARTGTLHFSTGQSSRTIAVSIVNDTRHEPAERFTLRLLSADGAALGTPVTTTVVIAASD